MFCSGCLGSPDGRLLCGLGTLLPRLFLMLCVLHLGCIDLNHLGILFFFEKSGTLFSTHAYVLWNG